MGGMVASGGGSWSSLLSPREREVALLVARGFANKEIARELGLSNGTVKIHVHGIFLKLGARKRYMLIDLVSGSEEAELRTAGLSI
jgi:DNA-binding NarL/FixJ family response regulator